MVAMPDHGSKIFLADKEVGFIGTVARHYELGPVALAVVRRLVPSNSHLHIGDVNALITSENS
jgi:folate-binding Fe-S cluster repair protein YgfZ